MSKKFRKYTILINSKKVSYWQKNDSKKKAIVFLHGFPGSHRGLISVANGLDDYRLIIPDLPGCGQSEPLKKSYHLKHYAEWFNNLLDNLSVDKVTVIGHSFGARLALVFSEHYSKRIEKMILITPVVNVEGMIARVASLEYKIAEILPKRLQKMWLSNKLYQDLAHLIIYKSASEKRKEELIKMDSVVYKLIDPATTIGVFEEFYKHSLIPQIDNIKTNTLVIASDKDEIAPLDEVNVLADHLIHSKIVVMKNSGHLVVLERPITTATLIKKWLKS